MLIFKEVIISDFDKEATLPLAGRPHVSFLLGAGFSVPQGYPTASKVNDALLNLDQQSIVFNTDGVLTIYKEDDPAIIQLMRNHHHRQYELLKRIIKIYYASNPHNYEEFYDFLYFNKDVLLTSPTYTVLAEGLIEDEESYEQFISTLLDKFNQILDFIIKDDTGEQRYEGMPYQLRSDHNKYHKFLELIENLRKTHIVDVHTLNHDLLFESFRNTEYINGDLTDGFDDCHSDYYGEIEIERSKYLCRLNKYTARYNSAICLFKLHGSLNYAVYHRTIEGSPWCGLNI